MRHASIICACAAAALVLAGGAAAVAQSGGAWDLTWNTFDGGGATLVSGGAWTLSGTIGQPDAGQVSAGAFRLDGGFWDGAAVVTGIGDADPAAPGAGLPAAFALHPSAPNPFNPATTIAFDLPAPREVRLGIYNLRGGTVRRLASGPLPAGRHAYRWDGLDDAGAPAASGTYVVRVEAGPDGARQKVTLVK